MRRTVKIKLTELTQIIIFIVIIQINMILIVYAQNDPSQNNMKLMDEFIENLMSRMTIEEKLGQLNQFPGQRTEDGIRVSKEHVEYIKKGYVGSFLSIAGAVYLGELQRFAVEESRLGIPLIIGYDVIHGFRTIFPVSIAEACSWDPEAVERSARIAATEAAAAGIHWTFAPMVDIARDPRWGRIVEGSGEDPYLGSIMAAARVRGFQGEDLSKPNTLLACAKHFVAYGGAEGGRDYNTVDVSERTLHEIYLPPFHAAVNAGVGTVMGGFNEINGIPMHANRYLLTEILRGKWDFNGLVISDYNAIAEMLVHGIGGTREEVGLLALKAGVDMDMFSGIYLNNIKGFVKNGKLSQKIIDKAVQRVLRAKYQLGLFEDPYEYNNPQRERDILLHPVHLEFAREMACKSIVLLKNENNILPLRKNTGKIAVIGPLADDKDAPLGSWSALGDPNDVKTIMAGIKGAVLPETKIFHTKGCDVQGEDSSGFEYAIKIAKQSDIIILVLGESRFMSGEGASRSTLDLPGLQNELAKIIINTGKPVILILVNGRPLSVSWLVEKAHAVLETWFLGIQMGPATADVLFGDYNPSGKLVVSFPRTVGQIPIYYNHKNTGRPPTEQRNTSKYLELPSSPLFPFGYGLSYTAFEYNNLNIVHDKIGANDTLFISVELENIGKRTGCEVVQLYIQDPCASVTRPVKELRGFQRVTLKAGEKTKVYFQLTMNDLAFYNLNMKRVVEPGSFKVFVGTNSEDVLVTQFEYVGDLLILNENR